MSNVSDKVQRLAIGGVELDGLTNWPQALIEDYLGIQENFLIIADAIDKQPWGEVGDTDEPAFQNGWANVGGANDESLGYRKDGLDNLYLKGYIDSGTIADGTVVFTLPDGYWPNNDIRIAGMYVQGSTENAYQIEIQVDGDVAIYGVSGGSPKLSFHTTVDLDN